METPPLWARRLLSGNKLLTIRLHLTATINYPNCIFVYRVCVNIYMSIVIGHTGRSIGHTLPLHPSDFRTQVRGGSYPDLRSRSLTTVPVRQTPVLSTVRSNPRQYRFSDCGGSRTPGHYRITDSCVPLEPGSVHIWLAAVLFPQNPLVQRRYIGWVGVLLPDSFRVTLQLGLQVGGERWVQDRITHERVTHTSVEHGKYVGQNSKF